MSSLLKALHVLGLSALFCTSMFALLCLSQPEAWAQGPKDDDAQQGSARLTKAPKLIKSVEAQYPQEAIDARKEGAVRLRLTIDANGDVSVAELLDAPGFGLGEAARKAALQFKFEPAEIDNVPAPVTLTFTINFQLPILPGQFSGQVLDSTSNTGLPDVGVTILYTGPEQLAEPPTATMKTDAQGKFIFKDVPPGAYQVRLRLDAYRDFETSIEVVADKLSEAQYKIEARPINFKGQIREAGTRRALAGVQVQLEDPQGKLVAEEYTDAQGDFGFRGVPEGKYRVRIKTQGYLASSYEETIKQGEQTSVTYFAEAEFYDQYSAKTVATRERREVSRQTISLQETRRIPGTNGDVVRVVQNLPGVARAAFNSGLLVVRGSNPQDTDVFVEGDQLPLIYHFLAGPAVINSEMIESLDFYPGNFSAYYGRATAGIIDLKTRSPRVEGVHGFAEVDLLDASLVIETPITDNLTFAASGRRSYVDALLPLVIPDDAGFFISPYYWDYQTWLTYRPSVDNLVELFVYGSRDELRVTFGEVAGNENIQFTGITQEIEFHRGQLRWEWTPKGKVKNTFMASFGVGFSGFSLGEQLGVEQSVWSTNIRDDLHIQLLPNLKARFGLDMQVLYSKFVANIPSFGESDPENGPNPAADGLDLDTYFSIIYPAFYTELEYSPVDSVKLIPGLRVDHYGTTKDTTFSPRLTSRWDINKQWALKGGVGLFTQPPAENTTFEGFGNPNLEAEKALHYALGGEWRPLEYLELGTTLFYRDMFDLVSPSTAFEVDPQTQETTFELYNNKGQGRSYGAEFLIRHYPNNRFFGWMAYTLSRSERLDLNTNKWEIFDFDQTHILTLVAGYNLPWNIDVSARFQYVTGNPFTPIVGATYNVEEDEYEQVFGANNSSRNPAFNRLDLRVDKRWVFDAWMLGIYLDVQNVYNATNQEGVQYNYDYTVSQPVSGIPFFPSIGVNAKF